MHSLHILSNLNKTELLSHALYTRKIYFIYLPGLNRAGSMRSGLFVAPITNTSAFLCKPSNSANNCDTTLQNLTSYLQI